MRVAMLLVLSACGVYRGNGNADTVTVDLTGVVDIENQTQLALDVVVGEGEESAEITCDSNLLEYIEADVSGDNLVLRTPDLVVLDPQTTCRVDATVAALDALSVTGSGATTASGDLADFANAHSSGSGALEVEGIASTDLDVTSSGSGAVRLAGTTDRLDVTHSGSGAVDAEDLVATDAVVRASGSGSTSVTATRDIEVHLSGSGPVDVYGDPSGSVVIDDTGSGNVTLH